MTGTTVSEWIASLDIWPLVVMLIPYFFVFRRYGDEVRTKRLASLFHAIGLFFVTATAAAVVALELTDAYLLVALLLVASAAYVFRARVFPYRLSCPRCGHAYNVFSSDMKIVYVMDDHLCDQCR